MPGQAYSQPLFDLFSFARRGLGRRDHLSPEEIQQVARTVRRTPEVMVKVLPKSANTLSAVSKHLDYIGRRGELDLEGDDGERLRDTRVGKHLVEEWDLDLDEYRRKSDLTGTRGREPARLVHKLIFSMPAGTPPEKVLTAVKNFAREEFGLKHRYLMALHTDQPHPHVHLVVKAMSEDGRRLNIRKTTLQAWRDKFARNLRMVGVAANATRRSYRGVTQSPLKDGIYRAALRGDSVYLREQAERAAANPNLERLDEKRVANHRDVIARAWRATAEVLVEQGHPELARQVSELAASLTKSLASNGRLERTTPRTIEMQRPQKSR
jgi:hypothetical protein